LTVTLDQAPASETAHSTCVARVTIVQHETCWYSCCVNVR